MAIAQVEDAPLEEPIVNFSPELQKRLRMDATAGDGHINPRWYDWLWQKVLARLNTATIQYTPVSQQGLSASKATAPMVLPDLAAGRYRVGVHLKVRQASGATSAILATIGYTNNTVSCTQVTPNLTTNTTASVQSSFFLLVIDRASPLTWATTYASTGVPGMTYDIDITIEALN